jgi:hypothetical protein
MTNLPTNYFGVVETGALSFARGCIAWVRDGNLALWGVERGRWFDRDESHRASKAQFKSWALENAINMKSAVEFARAGWRIADESLRELLLEYKNRREHPPTLLAGFDMEIVDPRGMPARRRSDNVMRDIVVAFVVRSVADRFNLRPTRNPAARRRPSACSIVTEALGLEGVVHLAESRVNDIWKAYGEAVSGMSFAVNGLS